jgi:hypothetical protein
MYTNMDTVKDCLNGKEIRILKLVEEILVGHHCLVNWVLHQAALEGHTDGVGFLDSGVAEFGKSLLWMFPWAVCWACRGFAPILERTHGRI